MDKYFIVWSDSYDAVWFLTFKNQGECEAKLDKLLQRGEKIISVIVGKELTWKTNVETKLKEE